MQYNPILSQGLHAGCYSTGIYLYGATWTDNQDGPVPTNDSVKVTFQQNKLITIVNKEITIINKEIAIVNKEITIVNKRITIVKTNYNCKKRITMVKNELQL